MENKNILKLIQDTIIFSTDSDNLEEAVEWFEERRHRESPYKTQEFFDELVISQVAILFKILIDSKEVNVVNNIIKLKGNTKERKR